MGKYKKYIFYKWLWRMNRMRKSIVFDYGKIDDTIFLAGSGRSGTTWVEEIINYRNSYRIIFEPFRPDKVKLLKGWSFHQYLRAENKEQKFIVPATKIIKGEIRGRWTDQLNSSHIAKKRLIKDIRANLFLSWLHNIFPKLPIIFLMRHPCAVVNSRIKLNWNPQLDYFLIQDELIKDYLSPFIEKIKRTIDLFEQHIFSWCIENYVPLKQFSKDELLLVFYENLCVNPDNDIVRISQYLKFNNLQSRTIDLKKPSALARNHSAINNKLNLINSWRKNINQDQIEKAVEILKLFNLDKIYDQNDMPLIEADKVFDIFKSS